MNSTTVTRILDDNRIVIVRPCENRFSAWVRQDKWSVWQGGFANSEDALAWAEKQRWKADLGVQQAPCGGGTVTIPDDVRKWIEESILHDEFHGMSTEAEIKAVRAWFDSQSADKVLDAKPETPGNNAELKRLLIEWIQQDDGYDEEVWQILRQWIDEESQKKGESK